MSITAVRERTRLIELRGIGKTYADSSTPVSVLQDITLTIDHGEFVAIVGASGSGKSTLMNILGCLDRPSSGSYRFAGREISQLSSLELAELRRETFGFVFQQYQLVRGLSAAENVEIPAIYRGTARAQRRERVSSLLGQLGLAQRAEHRPQQLSGGQQQRVSIARALMNGGRVLLADEPTGALDRASGQEVLALLRELSAAGHTIIVVTHDRSVANQARRTIELSDGRVVADSGRDDRAQAHLTAQQDGPRRKPWAGVSEAPRAAWKALTSDLARTFLTLLGIVVGVASVVALLAVGEGTKRAVVAQLEAFGSHRLYVSPKTDDRKLGGVVTEADAKLVATVPHVAAAMPYLMGTVMVRYGNVDHRTNGVAVTTAFPRILHWKNDKGTFWTSADERSLATVCVLGSKLAKRLFPEGDGRSPLRSFVLIDNVPFQVIGVLESKGALTGDSDDDDAVLIPFPTGSKRIFGTPYASWISVAMEDSEHANEVIADITKLLTSAHHTQDFDIFNKAASVAAETETVATMTMLLLIVAIISLVVGGIGVMNVMLMTVTERTGEIGIRMAVGASRSDVLAQFLAEAVVLAAIGGVIGLLAGFGMGYLCTLFDQKVIFTPLASVLGFGCAVLTGLVCGYLPARRAAGLDPVVALARQ